MLPKLLVLEHREDKERERVMGSEFSHGPNEPGEQPRAILFGYLRKRSGTPQTVTLSNSRFPF